MINMNTQKRVSFGSYGSMVETWVIEDFPEHQTEPEDNFFKNLVNTANIKESSQKIQESVRICDLDDLVNDVPIIKKEISQPSHDKARNNKVSFCDTPNEITSAPSAPPGELSPTGTSETIVLSDTPLGIWPVKRSASLESRDNPFKPDGELCKEAEDILKRATIVRDTFILNDNSEKDTSKTSKDSSNGAQPILEESISQTKVNESQSSPVSIQPKQNGVEDKKVSPESVKQEVESNVVNDVNFKDKKKQKKCCSVM
ncbi:uncharacterized protein LOC133184431 isoform X2 [Saccostrea echinata]|uniref:uncharacterized protein LOC133184431 isoform X2 n=1 Tax=Saccostrea echinata TaxID=191078 RepID=UPI002A817456|nr:uncharacterized protein LOC133184431 isoform X2 [Saccostrea echinata]